MKKNTSERPKSAGIRGMGCRICGGHATHAGCHPLLCADCHEYANHSDDRMLDEYDGVCNYTPRVLRPRVQKSGDTGSNFWSRLFRGAAKKPQDS